MLCVGCEGGRGCSCRRLSATAEGRRSSARTETSLSQVWRRWGSGVRCWALRYETSQVRPNAQPECGRMTERDGCLEALPGHTTVTGYQANSYNLTAGLFVTHPPLQRAHHAARVYGQRNCGGGMRLSPRHSSPTRTVPPAASPTVASLFSSVGELKRGVDGAGSAGSGRAA